ncbi:MAG: GNAT family N-acetyltransferase [Ignavibacteriae bacterium]|nr:GNAT family N-acetyltransferase [Ignavibacteriota bacterium]
MNSNVIISTERLILRNWEKSDIAPFVQMNSDPKVMKYFPGLMSSDQTLQFMERIKLHFEEYNYGLFAVDEKSTGEFIGFIGFSHPRFESFFTPCVEIGWRLRSEHWGKGLATEGAKACLDYGFNVLNFDSIYSFTAIPNVPSINVMKKTGMKHIGEFNHPSLSEGSWLCKHTVYKISLSEWEADHYKCE